MFWFRHHHHHPERRLERAEAPAPAHAVIARVAYRIWEHLGRPEGRDVECWLAAEVLLK